MKPRFWVPIGAAAALVVLAAAGGYIYFFSGLRTSPSALALSSPSPTSASTPSAAPSAPSASSGGAGTWTVGSGSIAGYRVREQFVGQSSTHDAVAHTSAVSGTVAITQSRTSYEMTSATITVQLSGLASVDSVAGYNVTNRDRIVQQALGVSQFQTAKFTASSVAIPDGAAAGATVAVSAPGQLTVHGVTNGVQPPSIGFTTVQPAVTIEFALNLTKSG